MNEIKYKKVWKDPGYCNGEFLPIKPLRGQVLDYWEMSRVTMPVRSYERYPVSKAIKNDLVGKEFGYDPTAKGTTAQYKKYLKEHNEKFKDFQYRPSKYTKVEIVFKEEKLYALKDAMNRLGITGMTVSHVMGYGVQKGHTEYYRGVAVETDLRPKVQVDIVVSAIPVRDVIETAKKVLYTGHIGDGKIFVYDVENVVKVRTGEEGYDALQDVE